MGCNKQHDGGSVCKDADWHADSGVYSKLITQRMDGGMEHSTQNEGCGSYGRGKSPGGEVDPMADIGLVARLKQRRIEGGKVI